jgi:hypothetical protein
MPQLGKLARGGNAAAAQALIDERTRIGTESARRGLPLADPRSANKEARR